MSESLQTNGWAERTLLNCLAISQGGELRSRAAGMQDVHGQLKQVAEKTNDTVPDDESVYMTGNRAFHKLHEKGLVEDIEDAALVPPSRYDVEPGYTPDDARLTEWVLTEEGFDEVRRLDAQYERELEALRRRFGRWDSNIRTASHAEMG